MLLNDLISYTAADVCLTVKPSSKSLNWFKSLLTTGLYSKPHLYKVYQTSLSPTFDKTEALPVTESRANRGAVIS